MDKGTKTIKQTIKPEVIGVIVVADGAENQVIKENIKNAVEAVVNISSTVAGYAHTC